MIQFSSNCTIKGCDFWRGMHHLRVRLVLRRAEHPYLLSTSAPPHPPETYTTLTFPLRFTLLPPTFFNETRFRLIGVAHSGADRCADVLLLYLLGPMPMCLFISGIYLWQLSCTDVIFIGRGMHIVLQVSLEPLSYLN